MDVKYKDGMENECHVCGKKAVKYAEDPYVREVHDERSTKEWWCEDCYDNRHFDA